MPAKRQTRTTKIKRPARPADPWKTRPARRAPPSLTRFTSKIAKPIYQKFGFSEPHIFEHWANIVGVELARRTLPQRLNRHRERRDGAILTVRVEGAAGLELQHLAPQVIERINGYYGFQAVGQLKFIQGPLPAARPPRQSQERPLTLQEQGELIRNLAALPDGGLKRALDRLGQNVLTKPKASRPSES
jgi:hypothetical protein